MVQRGGGGPEGSARREEDMTIAVAVCYPPDDLRNFENQIAEAPRFERAVIVAADSRYCDKARQPRRDDGIKLALLAKNVVAVFAGNVWSAREALRELKDDMAAGPLQPFAVRAARRFESHLAPDSVVECLIAGVTTSPVEPFIIKLLCKNGSCVSTVSYSCEVIGGSARANAMFKGFLTDKNRLSGGYSTPGEMVLRVGEALSSTIQAETSEYIGGRVQMVWCTKDKLLQSTLWDINPNSIKSPDITPLSWLLDELS